MVWFAPGKSVDSHLLLKKNVLLLLAYSPCPLPFHSLPSGTTVNCCYRLPPEMKWPRSSSPGISDGYSKRFGSPHLPDSLSCGVGLHKCALCSLLLLSLALQIEAHCVSSLHVRHPVWPWVCVCSYMCKCADALGPLKFALLTLVYQILRKTTDELSVTL